MPSLIVSKYFKKHLKPGWDVTSEVIGKDSDRLLIRSWHPNSRRKSIPKNVRVSKIVKLMKRI
jgi:hypothetical protein